MGSLPSPTQVAHQGMVERGRGGEELVVHRVRAAFFAQVIDKLFHDFSVDLPDGLRIGGDLEIGRFHVLEENVAVEGEIEFRGIQQVKDDDIVALKAQEAQSLENFLGLIEQIRYQDHQPPPLHLPRDLKENFSQVCVSRRRSSLKCVQDLHQIAPSCSGRDKRIYLFLKCHRPRRILLFENEIGE